MKCNVQVAIQTKKRGDGGRRVLTVKLKATEDRQTARLVVQSKLKIILEK